MKHVAALLFCLLLLAAAAGPAPEKVGFKTSDDVELVADFYRAGPDAPTVICVPMFRNRRQSYEPLVQPLLDKGINVLTLDTRGHGESAPDLRPKAEGRDPELFRTMHKDVEAAIAFLAREKGCDPTRIGLVGASVGCSVVVDTTVRHPDLVRAAVILTPGSNYLGVPTLEHLKRWPGTRIFTFCSFEEEKTSAAVVKALEPYDGSNHMFFDGTGIHGTRMFGKVTGIEELIANFMESSLVKGVDLRVPQFKADDPALQKPGFFRQVLGPGRAVGKTQGRLMAWAVGPELHLGVIVDGEFKGQVRFSVGPRQVLAPLDTTGKAAKTRVDVANGFVTVSQASAGGKTWVEFSLPRPEKRTKLRVEFLGGPKHEVVARLPGGKRSFDVTFQPR